MLRQLAAPPVRRKFENSPCGAVFCRILTGFLDGCRIAMVPRPVSTVPGLWITRWRDDSVERCAQQP